MAVDTNMMQSDYYVTASIEVVFWHSWCKDYYIKWINKQSMSEFTLVGNSVVMSQPVTQQLRFMPHSSSKVFTDEQAVIGLPEQEDEVYDVWKNHSFTHRSGCNDLLAFSGRVMALIEFR